MTVKLSPLFNDAPYVDSSGNPVSGGLLYSYTAGSSTPETTYTTSAGGVANANPIVLNSAGYPSASGSQVQVWLTSGVSYKFKLTTSAAVELWTRDNISGINDTTVSQDQWASGATPTYISATSFSLVGDQTSTYHVGRRLKTTNSGGTVYSFISATAYGSVTTVTVVNDSGTLDSGLSAVSYGLLSASNPSTPNFAGPSSNTAAPAAQLFVRGGQIGFPATQVASTDANTLDDYEEGTWTPVVAGSSTAGTQTYSAQTGRYTKIGRLVTLEFRVTMTVKDAATAGNMLITGLPFAVGLTLSGGGIGMCANVDFSASYTQFGLLGNGGASSLFCTQFGDNQVLSLLQAAAIQATTDIAATITYSV